MILEPSVKVIVCVACGGAIGAVLRYGIQTFSKYMIGSGAFPYGALCINVFGSFLMGVLFALFMISQPSDSFRAFFMVGILGAFTTFSTFSLDVYALYIRGETMAAGLYAALSVGLSILAVFAGIALIR